MRGVVFILLLLLNGNIFSQEKTVSINKKFLARVHRVNPVIRDSYLLKFKNAIITGRGFVESVDNIKRYRQYNRVIILDRNKKSKISFVYYIFYNKKMSEIKFSKKIEFLFKGQVMSFTPTSSKRDEYIVDVVLKEASIVVD